MNYIVVFRARSETLKFSSLLSSYRVPNIVVTTPRQISVSCGISVKIGPKGIDIAKTILSRRQFYTFAGIYTAGNDFVKI